jgi:hypothetical protein
MAEIGGISSRKNRMASVIIPGESGKKTTVTADVDVGPICQREKKRGTYRFGNLSNWAAGRFPFLGQSLPRGPFLFSQNFLFFFSCFLLILV